MIHTRQVSYYEAQQHEEVLKLFKQMLKQNRDHMGNHVRMAATYVQLGNLKEAKKSASEVLRVKPEFSLHDFL